MKKLLTIAFTLLLGASLSFAQATGGSTDKGAGDKGTTTTKAGKKTTTATRAARSPRRALAPLLRPRNNFLHCMDQSGRSRPLSFLATQDCRFGRFRRYVPAPTIPQCAEIRMRGKSGIAK